MAQAGTGAKARAYRVLHLLGRGGLGDVYLAQEEGRAGAPRQVALRIVAPSLLADESHLSRIRKVGLALGWVPHPGVLRYELLPRLAGTTAVICDHVEGATVRELLSEPLPSPGLALQIAEQVAVALLAVGSATDRKGRQLKLIHRDIKPSNLLVTPSGDVRLLDFGLARKELVHEAAANGDATFGSLAFHAPERSQSADTHAVDIHALGMTLLAMLLGSTPPGQPGPLRPDAHADRMRKLDGLLAKAKVPVGVRTLVREATAVDPRRRPSARVFAQACRALQGAYRDQSLQAWAGARVAAVLRSRGQPPGELTGQILEEASARPRRPSRIPLGSPAEDTPPTVARSGPQAAELSATGGASGGPEPTPRAEPSEVLASPRVARFDPAVGGAGAHAQRQPAAPAHGGPIPRSPAPPQAGPASLRPMPSPPPGSEDVTDDSTVIRGPSDVPSPLGDLSGRSFIDMDEPVGDPATVIRDSATAGLSSLPSSFDTPDGQDRTVIKKNLGQSVAHHLETTEMAPPRDEAPGEETMVEPTHRIVPFYRRRRFWLGSASLVALGVIGVVALTGVSAFLGGTAAFSGILMNLATVSTEQRCAANVDIGREFVQEVRLRPRREALHLLDDLQSECVSSRIGFWGTVFVIVELRNRGDDGILTEYEQHKVREVIREWSQ